ncbi:DUF2946 family protein [Parachitinimonas caeni]|uniref:DUF2946 family protein n=1 Tax=Parachitinimonas caeni TaxID=3031301 RepID=A0ABT7E008_9NEIS|nr:DUF2946 family protein [Parachitinimonas caeni]MDK2125642.1 DUF2946 family protein [Parachitinimonas caeni]
MDPIVFAALAKWPNVPAVYGWLRLNRRGEWLIRDEMVSHSALRDFIARNCSHDEAGRWFFQNGPQRVYLTLDATPQIWRYQSGGFSCLAGHHHELVEQVVLDEEGNCYAIIDGICGLIDDRDLADFANGFSLGAQRCTDADLEQELDRFDRDCRLNWRGSPVIKLLQTQIPGYFGFQCHPSAE